MGLSMGSLFGGGGDPFNTGWGVNKPGLGIGGSPSYGQGYNAASQLKDAGLNSFKDWFTKQYGMGPFANVSDPTSNGLFSGPGASRAGWYLQHPGQIIPGAYDVLTGQEQPMTTYNRNAAYAQGQAQAGANAGRSYAGSRGLTGGVGAGVANQAAQGPLMQWLSQQAGMSGGTDFMNMLAQIMMMSGYGG